MENKFLQDIKREILNSLGTEKIKIILFGSRARGDHAAASDVDIGFIPQGEINYKKIILLKEKFENMNIPYKIELVDLSRVSDAFFVEAMRGAVIWKG